MRLPMLASLCTVPFLFFKATEAQGNWFGGRPTVASPSVKKNTVWGDGPPWPHPSYWNSNSGHPQWGCGKGERGNGLEAQSFFVY